MEKGIKTCLWIFSILSVIDLATTYMNSKYIILLEINPIYVAFKSFIPILILNIGLFFAIYFTYKNKSYNQRFLMVNLICWQAVARIIAIYTAISLFIAKPEISDIVIASPEAKVVTYGYFALAVMIVPVLVTQIAFWLFRIDHLVFKK